MYATLWLLPFFFHTKSSLRNSIFLKIVSRFFNIHRFTTLNTFAIRLGIKSKVKVHSKLNTSTLSVRREYRGYVLIARAHAFTNKSCGCVSSIECIRNRCSAIEENQRASRKANLSSIAGPRGVGDSVCPSLPPHVPLSSPERASIFTDYLVTGFSVEVLAPPCTLDNREWNKQIEN